MFEQILEAGTAKRSTTASTSTDNQLQETLTSGQQAISSAASNLSQALRLNNLNHFEAVTNLLHNQTLSFARRMGKLAEQIQNDVSLHNDAVSSSEDVYQILKCRLDQEIFNTQHT